MPGLALRRVKTMEDVQHNFRVLYWLVTGRADDVNVLRAKEAASADGVHWDNIDGTPSEFTPVTHGNAKHDPNFLSEIPIHGNTKHEPNFLSEIPIHGNTKHEPNFATDSDLTSHTSATDNPHSVTATQTNALPQQSGASLPAASVDYRGQFFLVEGGTGVADVLYVCVKDGTDSYVWKVVTLA